MVSCYTELCLVSPLLGTRIPYAAVLQRAVALSSQAKCYLLQKPGFKASTQHS